MYVSHRFFVSRRYSLMYSPFLRASCCNNHSSDLWNGDLREYFESMGGMCNQLERNRSPKRNGKRKKKALKQLEGLVSARSPLGIFTYYITKLCRPFRKSTGRLPVRQVSCKRSILQDPEELVMDSPLSRPQDYPEEYIYPTRTEGSQYNVASFHSGPYTRLLSDQFQTHRNQGVQSRVQSCPISAVSSHHSMERVDNGFVVDIGSSSSYQSRQFQRRLESSSNSGSHESRARGNHKRRTEETTINPNLAPDDNCDLLQDFQSWQSHVEILPLKKERQSLRDANAALLKEVQAYALHVANLNREVETARDELTRHLKNCRKSDYIAGLKEDIQQKHDEIMSLNEEVRSLKSTVAELQTSHEHESPERPKSANREGYAQQNAISGSYVDESATPILLNDALSSAKGALKKFQKALTDAIKSKGDLAAIIDLLQPDTIFARTSHVSFAAKAVVYRVLFEGFENESFNTCSGVSRFVDPDVRQAEFLKYFLREQDQNDTCDIGDPLFESFCEMKVLRLWEEFNLRKESNKQRMQVDCLEALGGLNLLSSFRAAAKRVWLLHKLAFSFEPPASIFRVEQGATVDLNYMEPMVSLEDSNRFVNEVGFMISPGFRLRKTILRCEVYLSSTKFPTA